MELCEDPLCECLRNGIQALELANEINALRKRLDILEKFIMSIDVEPRHTIK